MAALTITEESVGKIKSVLDYMEKKRLSYLFPALWQGLLAGVIISAIAFLFVGELILTVIVCIGICLWASFMYRRSLLSDVYKVEVMPRLVEALGNDVHYKPTGGVAIKDFRQCELFMPKDSDGISVEDQVYGKIGNTDFVFCEASYFYKYKDDDGNEQKSNLFRGLAFDADFNKYFHGITLLCSSRPKHLSKSDYPEVKLEDIKFGKNFRVYSTDEVEARYILTPALQERFNHLVESMHGSKAGKSIMVSFHGTRILILISTKKDRFEAKILSKLTMKRVEEDFAVLTAMGGIVEELNLNTRIWTKK